MRAPGAATGRPWWVGLALMAGGHFTVDTYAGMLVSAMPALAVQFDLSLARAGLVLSVVSAVSSLSQPVFGHWLDRAGLRPWMLYASLILAALFTGGTGLAPRYAFLPVLGVLAGVGVAFYHPLGALAIKGMTVQHRGLAMSMYSAAGTLGYALAPVAVVPLTARHGAVALAPLAVPGLLLTALYALHRRAWSTGWGEHPGSTRRVGPATWSWSQVIILNGINSLRAWAHMAVVAYLVFYLQERGWSPGATGLALSLHILSGAAGGIAAGALSDRWGRRQVFAGSLLLAAGFIAAIPQAATVWTWVLLGASGAAVQATFPVAVVLAQELLPANAGLASGMTMGLAFGLGGLGIAASGGLADAYGLTAVFYSSAVLLLVAALLCGFLSLPHQKTEGMAGQ